MFKNVGSPDRVIRIVIGIAAIAAGFFFQSWWGALGAIPLVTAMVGWCPLYRIGGLSTCKAKSVNG